MLSSSHTPRASTSSAILQTSSRPGHHLAVALRSRIPHTPALALGNSLLCTCPLSLVHLCPGQYLPKPSRYDEYHVPNTAVPQPPPCICSSALALLPRGLVPVAFWPFVDIMHSRPCACRALQQVLAHLCPAGWFTGILSMWTVCTLGLVPAGSVCTLPVYLPTSLSLLVWHLSGLSKPVNLSSTQSAEVRSEPQPWGTLSGLPSSGTVLQHCFGVLFTILYFLSHNNLMTFYI